MTPAKPIMAFLSIKKYKANEGLALIPHHDNLPSVTNVSQLRTLSCSYPQVLPVFQRLQYPQA